MSRLFNYTMEFTPGKGFYSTPTMHGLDLISIGSQATITLVQFEVKQELSDPLVHMRAFFEQAKEQGSDLRPDFFVKKQTGISLAPSWF